MVGIDRKYIFLVICIISHLSLELSALQLVGPSLVRCADKELFIERKLNREFYVRAAALTASACFGAYTMWNFFMVPSPVVPSPSPQKWVPTEWFKKLIISLPALVAQTICVQWCVSKITANSADPRVFITKYIHYKAHEFEIDRLLLEYSADKARDDNHNRIDLLIEGHLQALLDKTEFLMAYMLYYAAHNTLPNTVLNIQNYAAEVINKLEVAAIQCNANQEKNYHDAVITCKKACSDLLLTSIRYAISTLPCAE